MNGSFTCFKIAVLCATQKVRENLVPIKIPIDKGNANTTKKHCLVRITRTDYRIVIVTCKIVIYATSEKS